MAGMTFLRPILAVLRTPQRSIFDMAIIIMKNQAGDLYFPDADFFVSLGFVLSPFPNAGHGHAG
jgi:hypothetical protein